jgi:hypothetical protein
MKSLLWYVIDRNSARIVTEFNPASIFFLLDQELDPDL